MAADPSVSHKAWCERLLLEQAGTVGMKEALRQILLRITGGAEADTFFKELCTDGKHPQSVCNKTWKRGSIAYRCLVCEIDPTSAICPDCFRAGSHANHEYRIVQSAGCCDCGDETAWRRTGFCPAHGCAIGADGSKVYEPRLPADTAALLRDTLDVAFERLARDCLITLQWPTDDATPAGAAHATAAGSPAGAGEAGASAAGTDGATGGSGSAGVPAAASSACDSGAAPALDATPAPGPARTDPRRLLFAARHNELPVLKAALASGVNPDAADTHHDCRPTALHWAAQFGFLQVAKALLDAGASVHLLNAYRQTPLQVAAFEGHLPLIKLLLSHGADPLHSDMIYGSATYIAEHEASHNGAKAAALLRAAVEARRSATPAGLGQLTGGAEVAVAAGAASKAGGAAVGAVAAGEASGDSAVAPPRSASSCPPYGAATGPAALQMVRGMLGWLSALCEHGDSIREVAAAAASAPPLLRICLSLRIACDRPKGVPGSIPGLAVAQPLSELDELCQSLLLFDTFRERLIADSLRLYNCHIGLTPPPGGEEVSAWRERPGESAEGTGTSGGGAAAGVGSLSAPGAAAASAAGTSPVAPRASPQAPTEPPSPLLSLLSLGKSSFLDTFSTRLFTGRAHTSASVVDRAVPTLVKALRDLLRLTLVPAGVGCLLPEPPSLRAKADVLTVDARNFSGSMVVQNLLKAGFGYVNPVVTMIPPTDGLPYEDGRGAVVIFPNQDPAETAEFNERLNAPLATLLDLESGELEGTLFRVEEAATPPETTSAGPAAAPAPAAAADVLPPRVLSFDCPPGGARPRLFRIEHQRPAPQASLGGETLVEGTEMIDGICMCRSAPILTYVYTSHASRPGAWAACGAANGGVVALAAGTSAPAAAERPSVTTPEAIHAAETGRLGYVCSKHYVLSSHGYAQTLTNLEHLLSHRDNAIQFLTGAAAGEGAAGAAAAADNEAHGGGGGGTAVSPGAAAAGRPAAGGRYFCEWLSILGWVQHMSSLPREERDLGAAPREDSDDPADHVWVHAFCLSVQMSALMPSLLAPLVDSCGAAGAPAGASPAGSTRATRLVVRDCAGLAWHCLLEWLCTANASTVSTPPTGPAASARSTPPPPDSLLPLWPSAGDPRGPPLISHHLPLHRAVAHFLYAGIARGLDPFALLPGLDPAAAAAALEHPLRLQLLPMQLRLRGWSGSGRNPWAADQFYRGRLHREGGWARDMLLIQVCACVLGPEAFVRRLRARLPGALAGDGASAGAPAAGPPLTGDDACRSALEEALWLVLTLLKDWALHGEQALRRDVIHQLALGPMPHSVLCRRLEKRWAEHPRLAPLLAEVGRRAASAVGGRYSLRAPAWWEVDATHPYYTSDERKHVTQRLLALPGGPVPGSPAPAPPSRDSVPPASPNGGETRPSVPRLGVSAAALRYVPQLGSMLLSAPLLSLTARALGAATNGVSGSEPLLSHALHLLLHGIRLCVAAGAAGSPHPVTAGRYALEAADFLSLLCDEKKYAAELAGIAAEGPGNQAAAADAPAAASVSPAGAAAAACGAAEPQSCTAAAGAGGAVGAAPAGASVISHLVRLTLSSSVSAACKLAAQRALQLACSASAGCGRARDAASGAFARLAKQSHTPGPAAADRDERRKQARAGRERMMKRMAAAQEAFAGTGAAASGEAGGGEAAPEPSPVSQARAAQTEAERRGLGLLLGDEDACCVLCKEKLAGEAGALGGRPAPACGLIARVCAQRLPVPPDVRSRREGVVSMLAQAARLSKDPGMLDAFVVAEAVAVATAAPGPDAAETPGSTPASSGRKRPREAGGGRAGGGAGGPHVSAAAMEMAAQLTSLASEQIRNIASRMERDSRAGGGSRPARPATPPARPDRVAQAAAAAARRFRLLDSDEARMLLAAGVSAEEILAGMGANDEGGGAVSADDESGAEMSADDEGGAEMSEDDEGGGAEAEAMDGDQDGGEEGEGEVSGESSGEEAEDGEWGPSSRELRRQRRMRRAMESHMGRVIEYFMERHGPGADAGATGPGEEMDAAEVARLARDPPAGGPLSFEEEEEEGEGEEHDDDRGDDDGMEGDDDGMSDEEAGLGYRSDLLRESEAELLQLLHGEVDDGGLATGGAAVDSHLTMLMNEGESDFGTDSEDDDDLGADAGAEGEFAGGYSGEVLASAPPVLRALCGWPLTALQGGPAASESPALRLEGSLLSSSSPGALLSTCGHAAHVACWHEYMTGLLRRVMQSEGFEGEGLVKPQRGEFVCPVCRRAANALLPLAPVEPADVEPLPLPNGKERAGGADRAREWARALAARRAPPVDEASSSAELRSTIEHFAITCTTVHGALPRLSAAPDDPRVRLMPVALLAHNAAVAELSCRLPTGPSASEVAATSLKLRALWQLARAAQPRLAFTTAALLACVDGGATGGGSPSSTASPGRPAGTASAAVAAADSLAAPPTQATASALMCVDPFFLFTDLVVSAGIPHVPLAAAHALAVGLVQAVVAMAAAAAVGAAADGRSDTAAAQFAAQLTLLRGQVEAAGVNGGRRGAAAHPSVVDLLSTHCAEILWRMRHLASALSPTPPSTPAAGEEEDPATAGGAPCSADAQRAASECLAAVGLRTDADARATVLPLVLDGLDTARRFSTALWDNGAAAFVAAGRASAAAAARAAPPASRLLATLAAPPPLPPPPVALVDLPSSFEALFHQVARKRCASCHATPDSHAVCLACAAHLCGLDTPHGARAIMSHAASCGVGTGLFLLTNNSAAVLVRERRLVFAGSPYRDAHGEVDVGLLRGKPLTLDPAEYAVLSRQWLNLAFDETARNEDEHLPMGL